jgi:hypothetical protein
MEAGPGCPPGGEVAETVSAPVQGPLDAGAVNVAAHATARGRRAGAEPLDRGSVGRAPDTVGLLRVRTARALGWAGPAHEWRCPACPRSFPVRDGIVHFLESQELGPLDRRFAHLYD